MDSKNVGKTIQKRRVPWNKGTKGLCKVNSGSFKKGYFPWNKDLNKKDPRVLRAIYERTIDHRKKMSKATRGISKNKGSKHPMYGLRRMKEKSPHWLGGKSFELYGFDWTNLLKHSIRTRDCFVCQVCKKNGWIIHHIDYNKKNNNPNNLITLCRSCHAKTNGNRNYWKKYLCQIMNGQ